MTERPSFNTSELKKLRIEVVRIDSERNIPLQRKIDDPAKISAHVHYRGIPTKPLFANIQVNQTEPILQAVTCSERIIRFNFEWRSSQRRMIQDKGSHSTRRADRRRSYSQESNDRLDRRKRREPSRHKSKRSRSRSYSRTRHSTYCPSDRHSSPLLSSKHAAGSVRNIYYQP